MLREFKRRFISAIPSAIFLAVTFYFGWNAVHGARGLEAQAAERAELAQARTHLAAVELQRDQWETKIADLDSQSVDPDMLDAQSRQVLNLAAPTDLVVPLPVPAAK